MWMHTGSKFTPCLTNGVALFKENAFSKQSSFRSLRRNLEKEIKKKLQKVPPKSFFKTGIKILNSMFILHAWPKVNVKESVLSDHLGAALTVIVSPPRAKTEVSLQPYPYSLAV